MNNIANKIRKVFLFNKSLVVLIIIAIIVPISSIFIGYWFPLFKLNENQVFYLFSTSSQVIAGLFGLTVTGYVFLRNELDRETRDDDSINEAVTVLKNKYFKLVGYLSIIGFIAIGFSLTSIAAEDDYSIQKIVLIMNIAGSFSIIEISSLLYFAFNMLDPNRIEKISTKIKSTFKETQYEKGSLEEFMRDYNELEALLNDFYFSNKKVLISESNRHYNVSNIKLINELIYQEKIDNEYKENLMELIKFRNSLVHGKDLLVSKKDNEWVKSVINELKRKIGRT